MTPFTTAMTQLLGMELPILAFTGGDAGVCISACRAGAFGLLSVGAAPAFDAALEALKGAGPFGIDVGPSEAIVAERRLRRWNGPVAAVVAPLPVAEAVGRFRSFGARWLCRVATLDQAGAAARAGADGLVTTNGSDGAWQAMRSAYPRLPLAVRASSANVAALLAMGADAASLDCAEAGPEEAGQWLSGLAGPETPPSRPGRTAANEKAEARHMREAAALRENLRRRKAQARTRADDDSQ